MITLEQTVEALKTRIAGIVESSRPLLNSGAAGTEPGQPWYVKEAGRFKDDPIFDEIVRLGREYRQSLPLDEGIEEDEA